MNIGSLIIIIDDVDYSITTDGTIRLIEEDEAVQDLYWIYVRANDEMLNTNYDERIGTYWKVIENNSNKIAGIYPAV